MSEIYLHLFHGRKDPSQDMDDWGAEGPLLGPFHGFQVTYKSHMKLIKDSDLIMELSFFEDMVYYDGMYYGDFTVIGEENAMKLGQKPEEPDESKCVNAITKKDVAYTETFAVGGGDWSIEVYDREGCLLKEFVGSNGTRDEADDLWGEYDDWYDSLTD